MLQYKTLMGEYYMLLGLYLGTTAFSYVVFGLSEIAIRNYANREGYEVVKNNKSLSENIISITSLLLKMSIPVFNIGAALILLMQNEKIFELTVEKAVEKGVMRKKETKLNEDDKAEFWKEWVSDEEKRDNLTYDNKFAFFAKQVEEIEPAFYKQGLDEIIKPQTQYSNEEYMKLLEIFKETGVVESEEKGPELQIKLGKYKD